MAQLLVLRGSDIQELEGGALWARMCPENILRQEGVAAVAQAPRGERTIAWSGWMGESSGDRDFRTWAPEAWARLDAACDRLIPELRDRGAELILRPHSAHVLSDVPSCLHFLRKREGQGVGLLLDPVAMLTGAMLTDAADYLERILWALGSLEPTRAVVVSGAAASVEDRESLVHAPLGTGSIDAALITGLVWRSVPPDRPRVLIGGDLERQAELLGAG